MKKLIKTAFAAAFFLCNITLTVQLASGMEQAATAPVTQQQEVLPVVKTKEVCMVTDRFFGSDQIPVQVKDQTYYGCCEMCKKNLTENEAIRYAKDPYSGKEVDKAKAVIAALPNGGVLYFENQENYENFRKANKL